MDEKEIDGLATSLLCHFIQPDNHGRPEIEEGLYNDCKGAFDRNRGSANWERKAIEEVLIENQE